MNIEDSSWPKEFDELATSQGWNVFECGGWQEIQRIDDPEDGDPVFESDYDAMRFILEEYIKGCEVAARALSISRFRI